MREENTRKYEIGFVAKSEEGVQQVLDAVSSCGEKVDFEGPVRRLTLAYPIEKREEGYFGFLHISLSADETKKLEKNLKDKSEVLRFLLIHLPVVRKDADGPQREEVRPPHPRTVPEEGREGVPLSNEALEKKIEEILK